MPTKVNKSIFLTNISSTEILKIIDGFQNKTSAGDDMISQKLRKIIKNVIVSSLTKLINLSIDETVYPDVLKVCKVIPVYKNGDPQDINNYRPISLLSCFNKIFEKKIQIDLANFVEENQILFKQQFGFRKYHSTVDALISTHDYIIDTLNKKEKILGIFIDLKKAFDSIDTNQLIKKIEYYGITGPFNKLLLSYLSNRQIYTTFKNTKSALKTVMYGVPQGSVLGPILFSLYINDIKHLAQTNEIVLFADDTSLFCKAKDYNKLEQNANKALEACNEWLQCNRLTLNTGKTHYLVFTKSKTESPPIKLSLGQVIISRKCETKYLGLIIQENLNWNNQIKSIINKINRLIPLFYHIRKLFPRDKVILIYKALVTSKINYSIELYGRKNSIWLKQLQKSQNRLLKIIHFKHKLYSTDMLHEQLEILKVHDQTKLRLALLVHRAIHFTKYQPHYLTTVFETNGTANEQKNKLRNKSNLHVSRESYNYKNKIVEEAAIYWNMFPKDIKLIHNRDTFKKQISKCIQNVMI